MERTLGRLAEQAWERFDDYESLFFEGRWYRSRELAERARRVAGGLVELGVRPGDRVVVMMANCPEVGITYQALWRAGAAITPVVFLVSHEELRHILLDSGARLIITTNEVLPTVQFAADGLDLPIVVAGDAPEGTIPYSDLEKADELPLVDRAEDDMAALMYTGGTTGRAKGVVLTHAGLYQASQSSQQAGRVPGLTRALIPLPLSHSFGLLTTLVGMHADEPNVAVLMRWFDAKEWIRLAAEHRIQRCPLVPAMIHMLLAEPEFGRTPLPDLKYVVSGAAPLAREALEEFERRVPGVQILEGYGMTETCATTAVNRPGDRRVGSVGKPLPGYTVTIRDEEGRALPPGEDGEICISAPSLMQGYWHAEEATAAALSNGELRSGDIGHLDEDGFLYIVDRKKDLIIRGGFNVFPRDVEDALAEHPEVTMAGVVGRPDPKLGEEVVAFVSLVPDAKATPEELIEWTRRRVGKIKYPREVHIVDSVPVTRVFKTDRKRLREMLKELPSSTS
ncbi:class I adenylate-forming enzyme family protein [Thermomonospora catenispora]|uniref:class I adenylate-forming enzyme family protein n=1 Tax=Thermomonospora catenispora TaxID=2493090 RepID=UPI00112381D1|nr:AMP-binding protein [Thermomonospora catenispora]TNY35594.1 acyl-CoA synthetase [Thermomonospora catenispora]